MAFNNINYVQKAFFILLLLASSINFVFMKCSPGISTIGYTFPHGDITLQYAEDPLEITCVIDDKSFLKNETNPSRLMAFLDGPVDLSSYVEILNETSIRLYRENLELTDSTVVCTYNGTAVCLNKVVVGLKPQTVTDFSCIGYNYDNLTCSWTAPKNYVKTNYALTYTFKGRAGRNPNSCEILINNDIMSCFWSVSSNPHYRQVQPTYNFELTMSNKFGNNSINYTLDHFKYVKPNPPENLKVVNLTTNSILLNWTIPSSISHFEPGLQYRILYQCEPGPKEWKLAYLGYMKNKKEVTYNLNGLRPHELCDIRVSLRSNKSDDENMWSGNSSLTTRTISDIPAASPKTILGSYELLQSTNNLNTREVYIYWQQVPEELKNDDTFEYYVTEMNGSSELNLTEITKSYAHYADLLTYKEYTFLIWSRNSIGLSVNHSIVSVPSAENRPSAPTSLIKIAGNNNHYQLHWEKPSSNNIITNYTIFWCKNSKDRPFQCSGYLNWKTVPSYLLEHNITMEDNDVVQFAIAANSFDYSSGMVWAGCTILHNKNVDKIKDVYRITLKSTSIELKWKLDCIHGIGGITGYIIYYCRIGSPKSKVCKGEQYNVTIKGDKTTTTGIVEGLEPYTTYMLSVSLNTTLGIISEQSESIHETTLEAAPSQPLNLTLLDVTNSSIKISWIQPKNLNGILKYYEIHYNNRSIKVDKDVQNVKTYNYTLDNLTSYESYNITIAACTTACSEHSKNVDVKTIIGIPGKINQPRVTYQNNSFILIKWDRPYVPRGKNDYYQISIRGKSNRIDRPDYRNITDTQYPIVDCGGADEKVDTYTIAVRAVNIKESTHLKGPWSDELDFYCSNQTNFVIWIIMALTFIFVAVLVYTLRKVFIYCKDMRNVELKLPPGLAPIPAEWVQKVQEEPEYRPPADEELLLEKISGSVIMSGDSSGCSSGHGSVVSDTGTTFSTGASDSGTEQNELRKRSRNNPVGPMRVTANTGYVTMPTDLIKTTRVKPTTGNYCVLGVDPTVQDTTESGYVTQAPMELPKTTLPYISCDAINNPHITTDVTKATNSGYIPLNYPEISETSKNPAYVMAGNKTLLLPDIVKAPEEKMYVQVSDATAKGLSAGSWNPPVENTISKGYVSIGEMTPPPVKRIENKGYVPHRHLMKED